MSISAAIANDSFALIHHRLTAAGIKLDPELAPIVERIIHSTADFDFAELTRAAPGAVPAGVGALQAGCHVVTDVHMVRVGISTSRLAQFGGCVHCFVADEATRERALITGATRSATGMRRAAEHGLLEKSIVAIGNAPTALYEVVRLIDEGVYPALVIGVPVGFVGVVESKSALMRSTMVPWIVTTGCKGGSPVAVAVVNALLRLAAGLPQTDVD